MKAAKESKVIAEVRAIRRRLQEAARRMGRNEYHDDLNRRRGWFAGAGRSRLGERTASLKSQA